MKLTREQIKDNAEILFRETLDSYESSFEKIEILDFLGITDKGYYFAKLINNNLTIEQIEKKIKNIYKDLKAYKCEVEEKLKFYLESPFTIEKDIVVLENQINKIDKYLEYKRLEAKYAIKKTTEKRSKI